MYTITTLLQMVHKIYNACTFEILSTLHIITNILLFHYKV